MNVIIDGCIIDSRLFRCCCINERLHLVYFIHRPAGYEGELSLPILFESLDDTREFFEGYCNALYDGECEYTFSREAWFSLELYVRIRDGIKNSDNI